MGLRRKNEDILIQERKDRSEMMRLTLRDLSLQYSVDAEVSFAGRK